MNTNIGENIRGLRQALGLSQKEFADVLMVSESIVSRVENGRREASAQFIQKICDILHAKPHVLYAVNDIANKSIESKGQREGHE